jgi:hypothetical protein
MRTHPMLAAYLVAYRGEQIGLARYPGTNRSWAGELGLPYALIRLDASIEEMKRRLVELVNNDRGSCVWVRTVGTQLSIPVHAVKKFPVAVQFATVVTCNFYGYFPPGYKAVKPSALPKSMLSHQRPFIEAVERWRLEQGLEQSRVEKALGRVLDLDPSKSER